MEEIPSKILLKIAYQRNLSSAIHKCIKASKVLSELKAPAPDNPQQPVHEAFTTLPQHRIRHLTVIKELFHRVLLYSNKTCCLNTHQSSCRETRVQPLPSSSKIPTKIPKCRTKQAVRGFRVWNNL